MKTTTRKSQRRNPDKPGAGLSDPAIAAVFSQYPEPIRTRLLRLRQLIFDSANATAGVGALQETLKWGQPSYLTTETGSGSTIRIDQINSANGQYGIYFHCQTDLVATFRELYPRELNCVGNRCIVLNVADAIPEAALRHCVALALSYHLNKRKAAKRQS